MSSSPTTGHADKPADSSSHSATQAPEELEGLKIVVLESAELATRSANMATNAGADLKAATARLDEQIGVVGIRFQSLEQKRLSPGKVATLDQQLRSPDQGLCLLRLARQHLQITLQGQFAKLELVGFLGLG